MPIVTGDLLLKLSITTGVASNSNAQPNPNASLGKYISTSVIQDAFINNLFDNISGDENAASAVDYRCIFLHNAHASLPLQNAVVWISSEVAGGANTAIGVDPAGNLALNGAGAQAATIANETTAPSGVTFSSPTSKGTGLSLGNIAAGQVRAIWVKRSATNSAAINADGVTIRTEGDTAA